MLLENQFRPLFALTPGVDQIQLDLDVSNLKAKYSFSIPKERLGEYSKVAVKFMKESEFFAAEIQRELDKVLTSPNRGVKQAGFHV